MKGSIEMRGIGMTISQYLKSNGIKQKWLSSQLGMSESRLSSILNDKALLKADVLFDICSVLNVSSENFRDKTSQ